MSMPLRRALSRLALMPVLALPAQAPPPAAADALLDSLVQTTLDRHPDLARAGTEVAAARERIPQARALPDPTLSVGIQNDGFQRIQVGMMETSYYQVMATQAFPWPGKRDARKAVAETGVSAAEAARARTRLGLVAEVRRAYYGLCLVRGQLQLLAQQDEFLQRAEEITRVRYEVGQGAQADLLRAQVSRTRLLQARLALQAEEATFLAALNRLRGEAPEAPVAAPATLPELGPGPTPAELLARAEDESPELRAAQAGLRQAERSLDLARLDRRPDFAVSAGVMPRGSLDPMWQVNLSVSVPLWSRQKQQRAVAEQEWRRQSQTSDVQGVRSLLAQRTAERAAQMEAALGTLRLYREGLLVQSEASYQAALAQYEAGRAPFLSVLEALNGWAADRGATLQAQAQALALRVAQEEFNLAGTPPIAASALGASAMGMSSSPTAVPNRRASAPAADGAKPSPMSM